MAELIDALKAVDECDRQLAQMKQEFIVKLRAILFGAVEAAEPDAPRPMPSEQPSNATPQQSKKRVKKHLSSLHEGLEESEPVENVSLRKSARANNSQLRDVAATMHGEPTPQPAACVTAKPTPVDRPSLRKETSMAEQSLMLPPPIPAATAAESAANTTNSELSFARPQRAAKLKSEKCLKEPKLNQKMRRPSNTDTKNAVVKLEHEQRASQMYDATKTNLRSASKENHDHSMMILAEEDRGDNNKKDPKKRQLRVKIKREKSSLGIEEQPPSQEAPLDATMAQPPSLLVELIKVDNASDESTAPVKKTRKKKEVPKPIKEERFSDIDVGPSPISSRTRKGSLEKGHQQRPPSIYEDAVDSVPIRAAAILEDVDTPPTRTSQIPPDVAALAKICNQTVTISDGGVGGGDATIVLDGPSVGSMNHDAYPGRATFVATEQNPNATVTLGAQPESALGGDATFNIALNGDGDARMASFASTKLSMKTARDTLQPRDDSLLTEDESFKISNQAANMQPPKPQLLAKPTITKSTPTALPLSAKAYRMPTRTNELFNPLVQSPVKKKVEAFENAVNAANNKQISKLVRPKLTKDNNGQGSLLTPNTFSGKDFGTSLGRFLTPTQTTNITPNSMSKKMTCSAPKVMAYPKVNTASNLKTTNSGSAKALSRENSVDEIRKGILEDRKRMREQKHILAAQQRETKERERAERLAKAAKEREERRIKKQLEAAKMKRDLDEIHAKLRHQEQVDAAAVEMQKLKVGKMKTATDQEREMLMQMHMKKELQGARKKVPPPAARVQLKYTFEMLHEDDSTDEEGKISEKRPQPPSWSLNAQRVDTIRMQQYWPTEIIDSFFSVEPMTPDLRKIFPNIDARHLKRNSSAVWSTPPRYSELPKY